MTTTSPLAVETDALVREFGSVRAIDGVSIAIPRGEIYGFLGPNGAGKSTVVRILCTLLAPTGGRAIVGGHDVTRAPDAVRLMIGAALQATSIDAKQTGRELLTLQCRLYGLPRGEVRRRVAELAELVDIGDALDRLTGTYSGGMRRRLDLALALVHRPAILFLDEPTTGLDPVSRNRVWDEVRRLTRESGLTIFLTTQYLEEADALAGRVGIIDHGRLVAEGTPDELKRRVGADVVVAEVAGDVEAAARAARAVAGVDDVAAEPGRITVQARDGAASLSPIALALHGAGVEVRNLTMRTPTLDDVFLAITGEHLTADDAPEQEAA